MNNTHTPNSGYVGLLALLIVCSIIVFMMAKQHSPGSNGQSDVQQSRKTIQEAQDIKALIEQRDQH
ncbi:MAG: hypothetical protein RJB39_421 [Candidatus Parcubacteria bacterium]|jgi:hypothetical protein